MVTVMCRGQSSDSLSTDTRVLIGGHFTGVEGVKVQLVR